MKPYKIIRYIEFTQLFELFFLSAILTILGIRLFLQLTGFPQLGAGELHIAHMLWGGFFMLFSVLGFMTFLNDDFKPTWTVLGGIGFGTFIDEIGKFITRDNDYFYQPTFAIIYVIFLALYLLYKRLVTQRMFSRDEYLVNSVEMLKEIIIHNLDKEEKEKALHYLALSNSKNTTAQFLEKTFTELERIPEERIGMYTYIRRQLSSLYHYLISQKWFFKVVIVFFIIRSLAILFTGYTIISVISLSISDGTIWEILTFQRYVLSSIQFIALLLQLVFTIVGALFLQRSRRDAYILFRNALFISIFILQVFNYYNNPLVALVLTLGDLVLFRIVSYMIAKEEEINDRHYEKFVKREILKKN